MTLPTFTLVYRPGEKKRRREPGPSADEEPHAEDEVWLGEAGVRGEAEEIFRSDPFDPQPASKGRGRESARASLGVPGAGRPAGVHPALGSPGPGSSRPLRPKRRAKVLDVGFWDLSSQVGELPRVIEVLNASQGIFRFYDIQAAVPSGLVSRPERVVAWAQERLGRRLTKWQTEAIANNVIFEDFAGRAKAVRKSLDLDYLAGVVPAKVAFDQGDGIFWNYFAIEEEKVSLVSTYGVYAYAQQARRPFEVAVAGIALSNLLARFNPKVEFHEETRGCLFDFNGDRDSIVEMLREMRVEPSCLALMTPKYRVAAAAMTSALRSLEGPGKGERKAVRPESAASQKPSDGKPGARPRAQVARK